MVNSRILQNSLLLAMFFDLLGNQESHSKSHMLLVSHYRLNDSRWIYHAQKTNEMNHEKIQLLLSSDVIQWYCFLIGILTKKMQRFIMIPTSLGSIIPYIPSTTRGPFWIGSMLHFTWIPRMFFFGGLIRMQLEEPHGVEDLLGKVLIHGFAKYVKKKQKIYLYIYI